MDFGTLKLPQLPAAAFLRRTLLRLVFLALLCGSAALVMQLLADEKLRLQRAFEAGFRGQLEVVAERLQRPSGELVLLNLDRPADNAQGSVPMKLPLGAIDFDDPAKAERAVELSGCALRLADGVQWCPAVGRRASAGAFVYAVVRLPMPPAVGRMAGQTDLSEVHRLAVVLHHGADAQRWLAPLELLEPGRGQFAGFQTAEDRLDSRARPDREFRGWLWQDRACLQPAEPPDTCSRGTLLALRIPVDGWRPYARTGASWPPADLATVRLRLQLYGPSNGAPQGALFDSARAVLQGGGQGAGQGGGQGSAQGAPQGATQGMTQGTAQSGAEGATLAAFAQELRPGESLTVLRGTAVLAQQRGGAAVNAAEPAYPWLTTLVRRLPTVRLEGPLRAEMQAPGGLTLRLQGDLSQVDRELAATATRYSVYFVALAGAIALAWLIVEIGLLRRMAQLTRRANALSVELQRQPDQLPPLDVADLRGRDELGILAGSIADLLARAREHLRREQWRAQQEREQWQAVGHEIMSPLQSLLALHAHAGDASRRYLERMQAALHLLYGQASVSEALANAHTQRQHMDLAAFLREVAANAPHAGIEQVLASGCDQPCPVLADPLKLEDALTHLLTNAQRYRTPGTPITLMLRETATGAEVDVCNQGPQIAAPRLPTLFELGTSDRSQPGQRGQGLFMARGYLAGMGGGISVRNQSQGVCFTLTLAR